LKVYHDIKQFKQVNNAIVTAGTFDGVHLGHRKIIQRLKELANEQEGETVLLTFFPHPRMVLFPDDHDLKLLSTLDEKVNLLRSTGIDHLIIHPFTPEFSRLSSTEYVRDILVDQLKVKKLVIGYDHHFGRNREGSFEHLQELQQLYSFDVEEIPAQDVDSIHISSTKIRTALTEGDVETANNYLGYPYFLTGTVTKGQQLGSKIGFPTANIFVEEKYKLIPANGVYAVKVKVNEEHYSGMLNIGNRPTVKGKNCSIEVHIFDFDENIYDQPIQVGLIKRIREEKEFETIELLREQLVIDRNRSLNILM
jgi:riboflavin kinase/FMN adenylyltransferase